MKTKLMSLSALALASAFIGLSIASDAAALPANGYDIVYYSDASMTNEVGERMLECNGGRYSYGVVTSYYTKETWSCD